jgi:3-oxoacyl-[acyl-carrier-protein] synthase II
VVVTGLGTVNPLGNDVPSTWAAALKGASGVSLIERFETDDLPVKFAAQISGFDPGELLDKKEVRRLDPFLHYAIAASHQAVQDSGLEISESNADDVGVIIGTGIAGLQVMYDNCVTVSTRGPTKVSPFWIPATIANMASGLVSIRYGARGPNSCVVTACTSGTHAVGDAYRILQRGDAKVMLAGGSEAPVNRMGVGGFSTMRALSTRNDDPTRASRPFDRGRDGFVIGEAGAVLILETLEHALQRGARIYGEVVGYGMSSDAHHMTAPPEDGGGAQLSMKRALRDGGLSPGDVDYINAHGTSTELNDKTECQAVRRVFGADAERLAMSSTKSMTGWCARGHLFDTRALGGQAAPDDQLQRPGSGVRSGLRRERDARRADSRGPVQLVRIRRHERDPGVRPLRRGRLIALPVLRPPRHQGDRRAQSSRRASQVEAAQLFRVRAPLHDV